MTTGPIVLLSDFGLQDAYGGLMKGVIAGIAPQCRVIDLTHGIPRGDVHRGAFHLWHATSFFPENSIFVAIVDPGVGTTRRALGVAWPEFTCIAPDNGLLTYLLTRSEPSKTIELDNPAYQLEERSGTFHGRDVFAPVAAHLANGTPLQEMGSPIGKLSRIPIPALRLDVDGDLRGQILFADHFGNLITSMGLWHTQGKQLVLKPWLPGCRSVGYDRLKVRIQLPNGISLPLSHTFGDVDPGEPVAYLGSSGLLEIGVNQGSAAEMLGLSERQEILLISKG
ncbi:MAG: SAM-dependent chlorinase/fluorinase [Anaerolineales bacterium]